jgi:magnesium-transporting ATPase (P-type)
MGACIKKEAVEDEHAGQYITTDHILDLATVASTYETSLNLEEIRASMGLTGAEAKARLLRDGPNALSPPKVESEWLKFFRHLTNPFLLLLVGAGVLSVICYGVDTTQPVNLWLGLILFGVVLFTAIMGYWNVSG